MSKIFGIGWAKTGTTTLGKCFAMLGYDHQSQRLDLVKDLAAGDLSRIMALANEKESFEDWPWIILYKELDREFPGSRFVLTRRESSNWLRSYKNMLRQQGEPSEELNQLRRTLYGLPFPGVADEELVNRYEKHNVDVLAYFQRRSETLLVVDWESGDGWDELCSFLNKPIPDKPFPHENRGEYRDGMESRLQPEGRAIAGNSETLQRRFAGNALPAKAGTPCVTATYDEKTNATNAISDNSFRRIIILPGTYHGWNLGDIAMLMVAVSRLRALWPHAEITALTYETEPFRRHCPEVALFPLGFRDAWLDRGASRDADEFFELMRSADLLLMAGCGALNDVWSANAIRILETFELAIRLNVPTAMMGQGIGPVRDSALLAVARRVLPQVQFIAFRDAQSANVVSSLGVSADRTCTTGDDALEMAYAERPANLGANIGVNLRVADYAGITEPLAAKYAEHLIAKAMECGAGLLGLPITRFRSECDSDSLRRAFGGADVSFDDGTSLDTSLKVIRQTRECRVVVTASYHAAVFALAMGVPAIGIARSEYYLQKFRGLAGLFGDGCVMIDATQAEGDEELDRHFNRLWNDAPRLRDSLIGAAADQIGKGRAAYDALLRLCRRHSSAPL